MAKIPIVRAPQDGRLPKNGRVRHHLEATSHRLADLRILGDEPERLDFWLTQNGVLRRAAANRPLWVVGT
jgi:hypothetical protein